MDKVRLTAAALPTAASLVLGPPLDQLVEIARRKLMENMTLEELKTLYEKKKAEAVWERAELERIRTKFSAQCEKVSSMEGRVSTIKSLILDKLMEKEGLTL